MLECVGREGGLAGQRVLVTGGSGFVGRACVRALQRHGAQITVVDREPFPDRAGAEPVRSVVGDLTEPEVLADAMTDDTSGVLHLAAVTSVLGSVSDPSATYAANVGVTQRLLELARVLGVGRVLLASTNAVTGDVGHEVIHEGLPLRPLTPYGATKAACEMLLSGYAGAYGLRTCALRFTNIYGPGMQHKDSLIPRLMRAAAADDGVQIYGDGTQQRDLVHVDDVVQAILRCWRREHTGTVIIGAGRSVSVLDIVEAARRVTGRGLPAEHIPAKPGEMPAVIVDITRAREQLGYSPAVSLDEGLATVWPEFDPGERSRPQDAVRAGAGERR